MTLQHKNKLALLTPVMPSVEELRPWLEKINLNGQYTNFGPLCKELEHELSSIIPAQYIITASSGTLGLELALSSLKLESGSRVLVPSMTFPATATAIIRAGLIPVFADIDRQHLIMTPAVVRQSILNLRIDAVVTVSIQGKVHDPYEWDLFTQDTGLPVLIDAAGVIGRQAVGRTTAAVFSLHATKPIGAGEGGFIATQDENFARRVRSLSNFGFEGGLVQRIGTNAKLSEYHAAVALAALSRWPETLDAWLNVYKTYAAEINDRDMNGVLRLATAPTAPSNICIRTKAAIAGTHIHRLTEAGIQTRRWYCPPLHQHPAFADYDRADALPVTNDVSNRVLGLPFHLGLDHDDIARVCDALSATFHQ